MVWRDRNGARPGPGEPEHPVMLKSGRTTVAARQSRSATQLVKNPDTAATDKFATMNAFEMRAFWMILQSLLLARAPSPLNRKKKEV